jgi:hypothetical protein
MEFWLAPEASLPQLLPLSMLLLLMLPNHHQRISKTFTITNDINIIGDKGRLNFPYFLRKILLCLLDFVCSSQV